MDIFHVEIGAVPAGTCHEESSVSTLRGHSCKDGSSKVFVVHDSLNFITDVSFGLSESASTKSDAVEGHHKKEKSPERKKTILQMVDYKSTKKNKLGSPEYRSLSPRNLEDPSRSPDSRSTTDDYLEGKISHSETENLLQPWDIGEKESPTLETKEIPLKHKTVDSSFVSLSDQISITSSEEESPKRGELSNASILSVSSRYDKQPTSGSPENQGFLRKKTLEELAREWHASQVSSVKMNERKMPSRNSR